MCMHTQREVGRGCLRLRVSVPFHFGDGPAVDKFLFFFFVTAFIDVIPNGDSFKRGLCDT